MPVVEPPARIQRPGLDAVHDAYASHAPELDRRPALLQQAGKEQHFPAASGFTPWTYSYHDWTASYDAESYPGLLQTQSDHLLLPARQREQLIAAVRDAIVRNGGELEYQYRALLVIARPE